MSDITLPQLGETVTEGTITRWFKQVGDAIAEDDVLFEVSTDKVDSEVPSPVSGVSTEILVAEGDTVDVGSVLARVGDGDPAAPAESKTPAAVEQEPVSDTARAAEPEPSVEPARVVDAARPNDGHGAAGDVGPVVLSPVVRKLVAENNLDPSSITGSGAGGRITRRDVEAAIAASPTIAASAPRPPAESTARPTAPAKSSAGPQGSGRPASQKRGERVAFSNIRRLTGAHMVGSKSTSPHVLTAVEVDYERVDQVRSAHKAAFKAEEGFSLTYLPFIARALIDALEEFPRLNASVDADALIGACNSSRLG